MCNHTIEQDHRAVKHITRAMLSFKSFDAAPYTLTGIELMHMVRKGQGAGGAEQGLPAAEQFSALAA
jgi:transposase-like protein